MANQQQSKADQEVVVATGIVQHSPVVSNGSSTHQTLEANRKDDKLPAGSMVYTSALSSNLSQLAELAASQAPSQMEQFIPSTLPQYPPSQSPGLTKYIVPGQNIPLPLGPQQPQGSIYGPLPSPNQGLPLPANIPPPFQKGSIIQLKSGDLKRVEDLKTEDFVHSVNLCPELKLETSTVTSIRKNDKVGMSLIGFTIDSSKSQVTLSCAVEHPFFVFDQGWASCVPEKSLQTFGLTCNPLKVGDVCIFLSPNTIQIPVSIPQGQAISSPRLPIPPAPGNKPGQNVQTSPQTQLVVDNHQSTAPLPANAVVMKQTSPGTEATTVSQAISVGQPSSSGVMTVTSATLPPAGAFVFDPQLGLLRSPAGLPNQFINQQVIGTMMDGKTVSLPGNLPPYYQTVPASLVGSVPPQSLVQTPPIQGQAGVGNGLVLTAVGLVPGMNQPGMVYASQLSEFAQKQGLEATIENSGAAETPTQSDTSPPGAKRAKVDGQ